MKRQSISQYYYFGTCVRYLQDVSAGSSIHGRGFIIWNIKMFKVDLERLGLRVTAGVTERLLKPLINQLSKLEKNSKLSEKHKSKLNEMIGQIRVTLEEEIEGIEAFSVTPKRIDVKKLIDNVPSLFAPGIFHILPDIARYDFNEAGKCIAFERSTAAAFHILRGTEDFLKHFYCSFIRRNRIRELMWGPVVSDLRSRAKTKKHETLYNNLDNIRTSYRNPTQHPEMIYDIHLVQDLWNLCTEVVNRMGRILKDAAL